MIKIAETFLFRAILFLIIFLNVYGTLVFFVPNFKKSFALLISLLISHLLSPTLKYIQTRGVNRIQLKWMFLKKPLIFNC